MSQEVSVIDLIKKRSHIVDVIADLKRQLTSIDQSIIDDVKAQQALDAAGKKYGDLSIKDPKYKVTVGADKTVKWDSNVLQAIAAGMRWEEVVNLFKITFEIGETKYNLLSGNVAAGLQPKELFDAVNTARTVNISQIKVKKVELLD